MPEPVTFLTGSKVSPADPVEVVKDTAVASFSASQQAAKNRYWSLTTGTSAFLPVNHYRASVVVDNSAGVGIVTITNDVYGTRAVPTGAQLELYTRGLSLVGSEAFEIAMAGGGSGTCKVWERSYI